MDSERGQLFEPPRENCCLRIKLSSWKVRFVILFVCALGTAAGRVVLKERTAHSINSLYNNIPKWHPPTTPRPRFGFGFSGQYFKYLHDNDISVHLLKRDEIVNKTLEFMQNERMKHTKPPF